jgi:ketosteroid isomerase-like protein
MECWRDMPPASIDVIREMFDAFNSEDVERILASTHEDFEVTVPPELSAEPDAYRGLEGMRRYWDTFQEAMEEIRFQPARVADTGHGILVEMHLTARGRQTGIAVEQLVIGVWEIRDGKAWRIRVFPTLAAALAALGLDEAPPSTGWSKVGG